MLPTWGSFFQRRSKRAKLLPALRRSIEPLESRLLLATRYVDINAPGPVHDGTTWDTAYVDLQQALAVAGSGDEIRVADGVYKPTSGTDRTVSFQLISGVSLFGGYAGAGAADPNSRDPLVHSSTLSGDIGVMGSNTDNSYHVVDGGTADQTAVFDGFAVTDGNANGPTNLTNRGGGLFVPFDSSPTINGCIFTNNGASYAGGGACTQTFSNDFTISNCVFLRNTAGSFGGGLANLINIRLKRSYFHGNVAATGGGYYGSSSLQRIENCVLVGNTATSNGGGLAWQGGLQLFHCTIVANIAQSAAGLHLIGNPSGSTVWNSIVWGNTGPLGVTQAVFSGSLAVTYCDFQGGSPIAGPGNVDVDPLFVRIPASGADGAWGTFDDDYGDVRIMAVSPVVDAGINSFVPPDVLTDVAGKPRFQDIVTTADTGSGTAPIADMGAYEAEPAIVAYAGGPYSVVEGKFVSLAGRGASTVAGSLVFDWEWDGDGQFDEATGPAPLFVTGGYSAGTILNLVLRVTDGNSQTILSTTTIQIVSPTIYVDDTATGANDGTDWADALMDLQAALTQAIPGQTIKVAQGVYRPTNGADRTATFELKSGVELAGGYGGFGAVDPDSRDMFAHPSILSGDIGVLGTRADNSVHIVAAVGVNSTAILDGFTVAEGHGNLGAGAYLVNGADPTFRNCRFVGNVATSNGGAVYASTLSAPDFVNCTFSGNIGHNGGAISIFNASPRFINCTVSGNAVASLGGGLYVSGSATPLLQNCIVWGNDAPQGSQIYQTSSSVTITYSDIGGGWAGGGNVDTDPLFERNPSPGDDGQWGTVDDDLGDLRLSAASPVADAGDNGAVPGGTSTDLGGAPRFRDIPTTTDTGLGSSPVIDMGAHEAFATLAAHAGSSYVVVWSHTLQLSGHAASDVVGTFQYEWEWTGDLAFDDGIGERPTFDSAAWSPGSVVPVSLRVTDALNRSVVATSFVTIAPKLLRVDTRASGSGDGSSWENAITDLHTALSAALPLQHLTVAQGTYRPPGPSYHSTFQLRDNITLLGGFGGLGAEEPDARDPSHFVSILSGDLGVVGTISDNCHHVVTASGVDSTAVLDGFTITGGNARSGSVLDGAGGGIQIVGGSPSIRNCVVTGNRANWGGGIYIDASAAPIIEGCVFESNIASQEGGAINVRASFPQIIDCVFTGNLARHGGAVSNIVGELRIRNCRFEENVGDGSSSVAGLGGAIYATSSVLLELDHCTFIQNVTGHADEGFTLGGAIYCDSSSLVAESCIFDGNSAEHGAGIYAVSSSFTLSDCSFFRHSALRGALYSRSSVGTYFNCTFADNIAMFEGAGVYTSTAGSQSIQNCIFKDNIAQTNGGGLYQSASAPVEIRGSTFIGNRAVDGGGAGVWFGSTQPSSIIECTFRRNVSSSVSPGGQGGAIRSSASPLTVERSVFTSNTARLGEGIYMANGSARVTNSLFVGHPSSGGGTINGTLGTIANCTFFGLAPGGLQYVVLGNIGVLNSVLWAEGGAATASAGASVLYSDVKGGQAGVGNVDVDPEFVRSPSAGNDGVWGTLDDDLGDLRLRLSSPLIDAAHDPYVPTGVVSDLPGNSRFVDVPGVNDPGMIVDMGAYEYVVPLAAASGAFLYDAPLPAVTVTFNGDVDAATLESADLILLDPTTNLPLIGLPSPVASYDPETRTARWVFAAPLPDGNYRVRIAAGTVSDLHAMPLAADYTFDFHVLAADANRDRIVDLRDLYILSQNWLGTGKTFSQGDFTYDGVVDKQDLSVLAGRWQVKLEEPVEAPPAQPTVARRVPTRTPTRVASEILG